MNKALFGLGAAVLLGALVVAGALKRQQEDDPFKQEKPERLLIVAVDDTGSMHEHLEKMWEMAETALNQEFRTASSTSKVIIARLSRRDSVRFIGSPRDLRQTYPSFEEFRQGLGKDRSPFAGSRIYDGIADAIERSRRVPGNPVPTLLVFSDMEDSTGASKDRLLRCLAEFGNRKGAAAGFYFVKQDVEFWDEALKSRVKWAVVATPDEPKPVLPSRD